MLASGTFDRPLSPPRLTRLTDRLGHPVMLYISSFVYDAGTKKRIDIHTLRLRLEDDPPATTDIESTTAL